MQNPKPSIEDQMETFNKPFMGMLAQELVDSLFFDEPKNPTPDTPEMRMKKLKRETFDKVWQKVCGIVFPVEIHLRTQTRRTGKPGD